MQSSTEEARSIETLLGINWVHIEPEQFRRGLEVEFEHGAHDYTPLDRFEANAESESRLDD